MQLLDSDAHDPAAGELAERGSVQAAPIVLRIENLWVAFQAGLTRVAAVRGVSLTIAAGEKLGIVGESGSGKTSIGMAIPQLLGRSGRIVAGEVLLGGRDVSRLSERELAKIRAHHVSVIFQDPLNALDPLRTVGSQISEAVRFRRSSGDRPSRRGRRAIVRQLLEDCEIQDPARVMAQYPHEISGGMRQRVMIGIALAGECQLLVADEPTTALDVTTQAQILRLLNRLVTERRIAVILITHNLALVSGFCDRVAVVYGGRVVEYGIARDLVRSPLHPYSVGLVRSIPKIGDGKKQLPAIPGMPPDLRSPDAGCAFEPRCAIGHGVPQCLGTMPQLEPKASAERGRLVRCHLVPAPLGHLASGPDDDFQSEVGDHAE